MILNYYEKGNIEDPVVLFLHGSASDATVWLNELNVISSQSYYCIALDLRGHGETRLMQQPKEHVRIDIDSHIFDVKETLKSLGIYPNRKVIIVTHSFGGIVAINIAELYPDFVEKLVLVAMPPKLVTPTKEFLQILLGKPIELIQKNLDLFQATPLRPRYKSSIMTNAHVLQEIYKHVRNWNGFKKVTKVKCKIYFAAGRFDIVAPASLVFRMHEICSNSEFELFKWSGHALMEDEPDKFRHWLSQSIAKEENSIVDKQEQQEQTNKS